MWRKLVGSVRWLEPLAIVGLCFVFAGSPTPAVNEAHYLSKAKHYWQPDWCAGDFFLESADAHQVFYWTFGWLTQFYSLSNTAWIGRLAVWSLFALAWCRMLRSLTQQAGAGFLSALLLLPLTFYGHLAGEWLIGGVEAKGFAYPLLFFGLACLIDGRWQLAWPLLGLASSFHVLVGGWAVIACLIAWFWLREQEDCTWREMLPWLIAGGLLALPGLLPALQLSADATREQIQEANITYTFRRLSHHLVPYRFAQWNPFAAGFTVLRPLSFGLACFVWWKLSGTVRGPRFNRLKCVVQASLLIACSGIFIDLFTSPFDYFRIPPFQHLRAAIMRYYWFRMSDVMVPVGIATVLVLRLRELNVPRWQFFAALGLAIVGLTMSANEVGLFAESMSTQQQNWSRYLPTTSPRRIDEDWRDVCSWFRSQTAPNILVLTPELQQTFKWYAHQPEVVTWKDVPQDAAGLVQWWQRRRDIYKLGTWPWDEPDQLESVLATYEVTHIVWPDESTRATGPNFRQAYRNELFRVFEVLPSGSAQQQ